MKNTLFLLLTLIGFTSGYAVAEEAAAPAATEEAAAPAAAEGDAAAVEGEAKAAE